MNRGDLSEQFVSGEEIFRGGILRLRRDVVRLPDGSQAVREYVRHPGAVAIVALTGEGGVVLERQHRYPLGRDFVELPAGKLEPDEAHLETAQRELLEETGYAAAEWTRLGLVHNAIGYSDESIELWLASGLEKRAANLDAGEFLEVFTLPFEEALAMAADGRISDVKTIIGLFWANRRR
ncbi:MAG: NUDIX hydrolase [Betaproteobacteria bacterium RBG_16_66_20]|nr:MAG: NUDIX hydrolase [Betaproteobacteria bacterium RBG_16_66_20]